MKTGEEIIYNHFRIFLNNWGEYCVSRRYGSGMVTWNSGFDSLVKAKKFINKINPHELPEKEIIEIAEKIKKSKN